MFSIATLGLVVGSGLATAEIPMCALPGEKPVPSPCRAIPPSLMDKKFERGLDRREYTVHHVMDVHHQCQPGHDPYSCSEFAADYGGGTAEVWQYQCGMCTHNAWHGDHAVFCSEDGSSMYVVRYADVHSFDPRNTVTNCSAPVSFTQEFAVLPKASALETHNYAYDAKSFNRDFQPYCTISPSTGCGALPATSCVSANKPHEEYCSQTSESCQRDFEETGICHGETAKIRSGRSWVYLPCCQPASPDQIKLSLVFSEITAIAPLEMSPGPTPAALHVDSARFVV